MNIALIDDLYVYRVLLLERLHGLGHHVVTFGDFDSFFSCFSHHAANFDLVITDLYLGKIDALASGFFASCRFYHFKGILALCSLYSEYLADPETHKKFGYDLFIDKWTPPWEEILLEAERLLAAKR
jgi:hypothetical protein